MKFQESLTTIIYEKISGKDGLIEKLYGYMPDLEIDWDLKNKFTLINEKNLEEVPLNWKREIENGEDQIIIEFPEKLFGHPIRNFKCLDLHSLKENAKETKTKTVQSFLLELGLMEEELNDAKMVCNFDLNKDPKQLTEKELAQFHLIQTRRDF